MIVALTGWGQDDDRRRTVSAGFDVHLGRCCAEEQRGARPLGSTAHKP